MPHQTVDNAVRKVYRITHGAYYTTINNRPRDAKEKRSKADRKNVRSLSPYPPAKGRKKRLGSCGKNQRLRPSTQLKDDRRWTKKSHHQKSHSGGRCRSSRKRLDVVKAMVMAVRPAQRRKMNNSRVLFLWRIKSRESVICTLSSQKFLVGVAAEEREKIGRRRTKRETKERTGIFNFFFKHQENKKKANPHKKKTQEKTKRRRKEKRL